MRQRPKSKNKLKNAIETNEIPKSKLRIKVIYNKGTKKYLRRLKTTKKKKTKKNWKTEKIMQHLGVFRIKHLKLPHLQYLTGF